MKTYLPVLLLSILAFTIFLAGCSGDMDTPVENVNSPQPDQPLPANADNSQPGDEKLQKASIYLDAVDVLVMESYPIQVNLHLTGTLPTPCHQLRYIIQPVDTNNQIQIELFSLVDPEIMCAQVLEPFDTSLPLGSFPSGEYTIWVNGEKVGGFDS